jgi:hypothetical protein
MPAPTTPINELDAQVAFFAISITVKARTLGLIPPDIDTLNMDVAAVTVVLSKLESIGLKTGYRLDELFEHRPDRIAEALEQLSDTLERTPLPGWDLPALFQIFDLSQLGVLLRIPQPDLKSALEQRVEVSAEVARRAHFLLMIVSDLSGSYTTSGIRKWLVRRRTKLDGRTPLDVLSGDWSPDESMPQRVRSLAASLVTLGAT